MGNCLSSILADTYLDEYLSLNHGGFKTALHLTFKVTISIHEITTEFSGKYGSIDDRFR